MNTDSIAVRINNISNSPWGKGIRVIVPLVNPVLGVFCGDCR